MKQALDPGRNNNPGNHVMGNFPKRNGAIGSAGKVRNPENKDYKFAVYANYETGRKAQALRLKEGTLYIDSTLNEFVRTYLGIKKGLPDTKDVLDYRKSIKFFTKFDMERTIRSLNDEEYIQLLDAMKKQEGWREGREEYTPTQMKKVLGVRVKRHVITEFLVGNLDEREWITKKEAIALAESRKLFAIVVHAKEEPYLRPKTHQQSFRKLVVA